MGRFTNRSYSFFYRFRVGFRRAEKGELRFVSIHITNLKIFFLILWNGLLTVLILFFIDFGWVSEERKKNNDS
jgi:hypothetical protein